MLVLRERLVIMGPPGRVTSVESPCYGEDVERSAASLHILRNVRYSWLVLDDQRLSALDDGALARRITEAGRAPDSAAESELYRRLAPRVRLYGLRHLRDRHGAADLVQSVLLMTLERLRAGRIREPERIGSFVLGSCRMTVLEMRRGTRRREALLETFGDVTATFESSEPGLLDGDRLARC